MDVHVADIPRGISTPLPLAKELLARMISKPSDPECRKLTDGSCNGLVVRFWWDSGPDIVVRDIILFRLTLR